MIADPTRQELTKRERNLSNCTENLANSAGLSLDGSRRRSAVQVERKQLMLNTALRFLQRQSRPVLLRHYHEQDLREQADDHMTCKKKSLEFSDFRQSGAAVEVVRH